jgi:hypothetical protein
MKTLKTIKAKWRVADAPTGRFRSFYDRAWPHLLADNGDGQLVAAIQCDDAYIPTNAKTGNHSELSVLVYNYQDGTQKRTCHRLKARFTRLEEAKAAAEAFFEKYPGWLPD